LGDASILVWLVLACRGRLDLLQVSRLGTDEEYATSFKVEQLREVVFKCDREIDVLALAHKNSECVKDLECSVLSGLNLGEDTYSLDDIGDYGADNLHSLTISLLLKGVRASLLVIDLNIQHDLSWTPEIVDWPDAVSASNTVSLVDVVHIVEAWNELVLISRQVEAIRHH